MAYNKTLTLGIRPPVSAPRPGMVRLMPNGMLPRPTLVNVGGSAMPNMAGVYAATRILPK